MKYVGYQGELPVFVADSREEIEAVEHIVFDKIEEVERAEIVNGKVLLGAEVEAEKQVQIQNQLTDAVQRVLDNKAQGLLYDNCLSVCSYIDTGVAKFDAEGKAFRAWRSAVWAKGYEILAQVQAGQRGIPTEAELIDELPELVIVYDDASA